MRLLRPLLNFAFLCLVAGIAGGLGLGLVLSRQGGWLTPAPWAIYAAVLTVLVVAISWLDEKRSAPAAEPVLHPPVGFTAPESLEQSGSLAANGLTPVDAEPVRVEGSTLAEETRLEVEPEAEPLLTVVNKAPTALHGAEPSASEPPSIDTWTADGNGWVFSQDAASAAAAAQEPENERLSARDVKPELENVGDGDHRTVIVETTRERVNGAGPENSKHVSVVAGPNQHDGAGGGGENR